MLGPKDIPPISEAQRFLAALVGEPYLRKAERERWPGHAWPERPFLTDWVEELASRSREAGARAAVAAAHRVYPFWATVFPESTRPRQALDWASRVLEEPSQPNALDARIAADRAGKNARKKSADPRIRKARRTADVVRLATQGAALLGPPYREAEGAHDLLIATVVAAVDTAARQVSTPEAVGRAIQESLLLWLLGGDDWVAIKEKIAWDALLPFQESLPPKAESPPLPAPGASRTPVPEPESQAKAEPWRWPDELQPARRERTDWRMGDVVVVDERCRATELGEGVIVDVETYPEDDVVKAALVRFDAGPKQGVWYSVNTLRRLRDIIGNSIC